MKMTFEILIRSLLKIGHFHMKKLKNCSQAKPSRLKDHHKIVNQVVA